jgi:transposase
MIARGEKTIDEAAFISEVSVRAVYNWKSSIEQSGLDGLVARKKPGRTPRLKREQLDALKKLIATGPEEAGFETGIWNARLARQVIMREFGVDYSERQTRRALHQAGCSVQYPKKTGKGGQGGSRKVEHGAIASNTQLR